MSAPKFTDKQRKEIKQKTDGITTGVDVYICSSVADHNDRQTHIKTPITLGEPLRHGEGGQAIVFNVVDYPDIVAKIIMTSSLTASMKASDYQAKLSVINKFRDNLVNAYPFVITPGPILYSIDVPEPTNFVGFVMPRLSGYESLIAYTGREKRLPDHQVFRIAAQCALALSKMHKDNRIIFCDFNPQNVRLKPAATDQDPPVIAFIDADSFQYKMENIDYTSNAYHVEYSSPRFLQLANPTTATTFKPDTAKLNREPTDDAYSLAIIFFMLLTGCNPFDGNIAVDKLTEWQDNRDDGIFPYADEQYHHVLPPDAVEKYRSLPLPIQQLFCNTFERDFEADIAGNFTADYHPPPPASEWAHHLNLLQAQYYAQPLDHFPSIAPEVDKSLLPLKLNQQQINFKQQQDARFFGLLGWFEQDTQDKIIQHYNAARKFWGRFLYNARLVADHPSTQSLVKTSRERLSAAKDWVSDPQRKDDLAEFGQKIQHAASTTHSATLQTARQASSVYDQAKANAGTTWEKYKAGSELRQEARLRKWRRTWFLFDKFMERRTGSRNAVVFHISSFLNLPISIALAAMIFQSTFQPTPVATPSTSTLLYSGIGVFAVLYLLTYLIPTKKR